MTTTDPLARKLADLKAAQQRLNNAIEKLGDHFQDHGCVREDLIAELRAAHIEQYKLIGPA